MLRTNLRVAAMALTRHRLRTALSVLSVGIGIAAVICTAAIGAAGAARVQTQIDAVGEDFLWIRAGSQNASGVRTGFDTRTLSADDASALEATIGDIAACSPIVQGREQLIVGSRNWNTRYHGVRPAYFDIRRRTLAAGTAFADHDERGSARVMVLGPDVSARLFDGENPVGRSVRMGRFFFRVIGVLTPAGAGRGGVDRDDTIFVPFTTAFTSLDRRDRISDIICGVRSAERMAAAEAQAVGLLRSLHQIGPDEPDDFMIQKPIEILELRARTAETLALTLTAVGAVSLLVGGVGIMNIMLVSVSERRREIGVRMASGARIGDIRWQFLWEAVAIGAAGGAVGVLLGWAGATWMSSYFGWPTILSPDAVLNATLAAAGTGLIFGYYPAHRASLLDPIQAIHAET